MNYFFFCLCYFLNYILHLKDYIFFLLKQLIYEVLIIIFPLKLIFQIFLLLFFYLQINPDENNISSFLLLNYILKDYISNKTYNKEELLLKINKNNEIAKIYNPIALKKEGKSREFTIQNQVKLISSNRKKSMYTNSPNFEKTESFSSRNSEKEDCISLNKLTPKQKPKKLTISSSKALSLLDSVKSRINSLTSNNKKELYKNVKYKIKPIFLKFFVRSYFSLYFLKLLNYDEDFINIRKIYKYIYHNEIIDIDDYNLNYPSKLKNRLGNKRCPIYLKFA